MRLEKWPTINRPIQLEKGGGNGATNGQRGVRKVRSFWSNGFSASIVLPDRTLRPGRKLQGKVVIHSKALVTFTGLRVQLDAQCTLFLEKSGELVTKRFSILTSQTDNNYHNSCGGTGEKGGNSNVCKCNTGCRNRGGGGGISCEAVEWLGNSKEIYALIPDINAAVDCLIFPFSLEVPGDRPFPCPFNNTVGTLVYKLSAHLCSQDLRYAQIAEEPVDFKGYANLSVNKAETSKPIQIERPLPPGSGSGPLLLSSQSSIASSSQNGDVTANFKVEASGFLPEEAIHFTLHVKNPKKMTMHMRIFVAQKITYTISENCWKKVTSSVVRCERVEVNLGCGGGDLSDVIWRGALIIPKGQLPSFSSAGMGHPWYGVAYTIQFKVEGLDHDWSVKGSAPLYIGTCRTNLHHGRLITG